MTTANLVFDDFQYPTPLRKLARFLLPVPAFKLHSITDLERKELEKYIYDQFQAAYHASVKEFMPLLFSIQCNGQFSAAAGVRSGRHQNFFLEQYLDESAERLISKIVGRNVSRRKVAEIGNMVATQKGSSQMLFLIFCAVLQQTEHEWIVFTATPAVLKGIRQLGFHLHTLGEANPDALDARNTSEWGSYYDVCPHVVAGNLAAAAKLMASRRIYSSLISLFQRRITQLGEVIDQTDT